MKKYTLKDLPIGFKDSALQDTFFCGKFMVSYIYTYQGRSYFNTQFNLLKIHIL